MLTNEPGNKRNEYLSDYVVFDLETTGISVKYDEVIEVSAIRVREGKAVAEFSRLVNPNRAIPAAASAVNGIYNKMVDGEPEISVILPEFIEFIGEDVLVGHNIASFDMKFIYRDSRKYMNAIPNNDYVDTLTYARMLLPQLSCHKLTELSTYYKISTKGAHRALNDCHMNHQVFEKLGQEMSKAGTGASNLRLCPKCGQVLKKRSGKFGDFIGCSGFPMCRYTEKV